ncbi:F-type H+-transporting ATPase subunit alpha [Mycoplasma testudineum]|uniref:F-type H+-transporting ATPase subunit alpha n=1 Tax=Mycoplasma testudineum TaxID=244584 RepID=A0A4R6I9Z4_9MOLU|nr:ATP F0F1 synthase subunit alpha [Mycoplasma testudineum]OYD26513.1 ATP F0F1 synthase subunit alpha [Mycoplasma testudineum]TDO19000.1 F-type H+-transporting ATPase subunit alpha [Mycoplasma testudineum]
MIKKLVVESIIDYIVKIRGSYGFHEGQFFQIKGRPNASAYLITAQNNVAYLLIDQSKEEWKIGDEVIENNAMSNVITSNEFFGNVINIFNQVVLPQPKSFTTYIPQKSNIYTKPRNMMQRTGLNEQLQTGFLGIDLFTPIGLGQRQLIIGNRKTGKTHIALNTIINQRDKDTKCIYVSVGQKRENLAMIYETLKINNALKNTIILDAPATSPFQQFLAPYIAMAHAENLASKHNVLIVFDDLTTHANIFREISLLIDKPIGKEAFPGDVFYLHSRLLEKSGKFKNGFSITCLPIVKIINNDLTSLIASNIISITDGQLVLDSDLFAQGKMPAINFDLSVSRTGSSVQKPFMVNISADLSKIYLAYKKQTKLANLDYELNPEISELIFKGNEIEKLLIQKNYGSYSNEFLLLSSKIISWGILKSGPLSENIKKLISLFIKKDPMASNIFESYLKNINFNEDLARNYFASVVNRYLLSKNEIDLVKQDLEFIPMSETVFSQLLKEVENGK